MDIDAAVLQAAKDIAAKRETTVGTLLPEWARQALEPQSKAAVRNGVPLLARRPGAAKRTLELVNRLRDEL